MFNYYYKVKIQKIVDISKFYSNYFYFFLFLCDLFNSYYICLNKLNCYDTKTKKRHDQSLEKVVGFNEGMSEPECSWF